MLIRLLMAAVEKKNEAHIICVNEGLSKYNVNKRTKEDQEWWLNKFFCNEDIGIKKLEYVTCNSDSPYSKISPVSANEFINIVHTAFMKHLSLAVTPDLFKTLLMQGVAMHVNQDVEKYRDIFVSHQGKKEIRVRRDDFVMGKKNPWHEVTESFTKGVKDNIGENLYKMIVNDFSTTTVNERVVSEITLMDCVQGYFEFVLETRCGIPYIMMHGTPDDWKKLYSTFETLQILNKEKKMGLDSWLTKLEPTMRTLCQNGIEKKSDVKFWKSIYHYSEESGSAYITGWIADFYPYIVNRGTVAPNPLLDPKGWPISPNQIPSGISKAPFVWIYLGTPYPMVLCGAIVGASASEYNGFTVLKPEFGWAVGQTE